LSVIFRSIFSTIVQKTKKSGIISMSTLLTHDEYSAIARGITYPVNPFINGEYVPPLSGNSMETINPATGEVMTRVAACGAEDVDLTVDIARKTFDQGSWSRKHPAERKAIIIQLAKLIERQHQWDTHFTSL
jgi:gamma-glutamyl-gamma-aminobutyraldehyde dehydrogenase